MHKAGLIPVPHILIQYKTCLKHLFRNLAKLTLFTCSLKVTGDACFYNANLQCTLEEYLDNVKVLLNTRYLH